MGGTATSGQDFTGSTGTLTFAQGVLTQTITVATTNDTLFDSNSTENFTVTLANASLGGGIAAGTATGIINDDDAAPNFSISAGPAVTEGGNIVFSVVRDRDSSAAQTVQFGTVAGTALAGTDFASNSGTLTFNPGTLTQTVTVATTNDAVFDSAATENFTLTLSNPSLGGTLAGAVATGGISDDEAAPAFSISVAPSTVTEGSSQTFTVTRNRSSDVAQTVQYGTVAGSAIAARPRLPLQSIAGCR